MKKLILSALCAVAALGMSASTTWSFNSKTFNVDTVYHAKIGPGTTTTSLELSGSQRLNVFYATIDLTDPNIDIRVVKASNGDGNRTPEVQMNQASKEGASYIIGTNADFFAGNRPCGSTIVDGSIFNVVNSGFDNFWMTADKVPHIGAINFSGTVTGPTGSHALHGINTYRNENQVIIYQRYAWNNITTAPTNQYGAELTIEPIEGELGLDGTVRYRVVSQATTAGGSEIPEGKAILAGHGTGKSFVQGLNVGDEITVKCTPACEVGGKIMQMASGCPMILQDGRILDTESALDHLTANNPRTAIGYSADRTKVVMLVVDGRGTSVGCVSKTLAGIMQQVGCADALNFDGGGSSCLYSRDLGVRNRPSDGSQRAVVNTVWAVATSPTDNTIAQIAFESPVMQLPRYAYYTPRIYGYNKYGVLIDTDVKGATLNCDPALGTPVEDGTVLFANGSGTHALTATYNGATAVIPVTIGSAQPRMRLSRLVIDDTRPYTAEVVAEVSGADMPLSSAAMTWTSDDSSIATVDNEGTIRGVANGQTSVTGTIGDFTGTLPVSVEIPAKRYLPLIPQDLSTWKTAGSGTSDRTLGRNDAGDITVGYTISNSRSPYVTVRPAETLAMYSLPDSLRMVINPGDARVTKIRLQISAHGQRAENTTYDVSFTPSANNIFEVPVSDFADTKDFISYPIDFTSMTFYLSDAAKSTHTLTFPALDLVYSSVKPDQGVDNLSADSAEDLVVTGSVTAGEPLHLSADAAWTLYTIGGATAAAGSGSLIPTAGLTPGVYIVTAVRGTRAHSAKVMVR